MLIRPHLSPADNRRIQAMLFGNQNGDLRQQLLDGAPFLAELTHTAVPQRAAPGTTATFTRATTKTVENNDGYLVKGVAGEIGFVGARRVRNLLTFTEDLSNAAWTKINGGTGTVPVVTAGQTDPDGGSTAFRIQANAGGSGGGDYSVVRQVAVGGNLRAIYVKSNTGVSQEIYFGAPTPGQKVTATTSWSRVTAPLLGGNSNYDIGSYGTVGNSTTNVDILVWHPQLEDVTAQTTQTAGEYVSVGVASSPYYHGSMVDGVKCFPTDLAGNPLTTMLGYLAEGARTNLCLQSNAFDNASWTKAAVSVVADQYTAPDGATTADKVLVSAGNAQHYIYLTPLSITAATYSVSFYCKYINHRWIAIDLVDSVGHLYASFDLLNGVTGAVSGGVTSSIESVGNGFYRISWTAARALRADASVYLIFNNSNTASFETWNAVGTEAVGVWGAQVELGSFASSYIATTTIAVARNADVLTYSSAGNILGTVGWAYAELSTYWNTAPPANWSAIGFGASIEGLIVGGVTGAPTEIRAYDGSNSVTQSSNPTMYLTPRDTAMTWGGSSMSVAQSGVATSGSFDGNIGTTAIGVGNSGTGTGQWNGTIRNVRIGQRALSSSELQAVTA